MTIVYLRDWACSEFSLDYLAVPTSPSPPPGCRPPCGDGEQGGEEAGEGGQGGEEIKKKHNLVHSSFG